MLTLKKKKCAGSGDFIAAMIVLVTLFTMFAMFLNIQKDYKVKGQMDNIIRDYALMAETQGGLTAQNKADLAFALSNITPYVYKEANTSTKGLDASVVSVKNAGELTYGEGDTLRVTFYYDNFIGQFMRTSKWYGAGKTVGRVKVDIAKAYTSKY